MTTNKPDATQLVGDVKYDTALFCDLKTDEEKSTFFLSGRGYETGVIAQAIQNDVAMAYHRCSEYRKELEALRDECEKLRKDAARYQSLLEAVLREIPHRKGNRGNAPGHAHSVPGIWDEDNGALAGKECAWCKVWNEAVSAMQEEPNDPPRRSTRHSQRDRGIRTRPWCGHGSRRTAITRRGRVPRLRRHHPARAPQGRAMGCQMRLLSGGIRGCAQIAPGLPCAAARRRCHHTTTPAPRCRQPSWR